MTLILPRYVRWPALFPSRSPYVGGNHREGETTVTESDVQQASQRIRFPGISPRAYEHPADKGAMATLRAVPGVADVLKTLNSLFNERAERLMAVASHVRVGPSQYPVLDQLRVESAEVLDLPRVPQALRRPRPRALAQTRGIDEPFIVLSTGLVEALDTEALRFVIGHEMGHVLSGHAVLLTLLDRLLRLQRSVAWVPLGVIGLRAVIAALHEWQRKSELSCDRAGLLAGQDPQAALRAHLYLAGATDLAQIDIPSFLAQAKEYEEVDDIRDSVIKLLAVEGADAPVRGRAGLAAPALGRVRGVPRHPDRRLPPPRRPRTSAPRSARTCRAPRSPTRTRGTTRPTRWSRCSATWAARSPAWPTRCSAASAAPARSPPTAPRTAAPRPDEGGRSGRHRPDRRTTQRRRRPDAASAPPRRGGPGVRGCGPA